MMSSDHLERPRRGAGEDAWREFAVELQRRIGVVRAGAEAEVREGLERARAHNLRVEATSGAWKAELLELRRDHERLRRAHVRDGWKLNALARMLLDEGDVPAAMDVLAARRRHIAAARAEVRS